MNLVLVLATTLAILAVALFALSRRARSKIGIPAGEIFYQDLDGQPFQAEVLRSSLWGISGKPDCLIRTAEGIVPLEFKRSKKAPARGGIYPNQCYSEPRLLCFGGGSNARPGSLWPRDLRWPAGAQG